jgi:hypothetical protein
MKTRIAIVLGFVLAAAPASAVAQSEASPAPGDVDLSLVTELCAANAADEAEIGSCVESVQTILTESFGGSTDDTPSLIDRAQALADDTQTLIDDAIDQAQAVDLQAALDDAIAGAQDLGIQAAIDDAVAAVQDIDIDVDVDIQEAIDGAVAEALAATEEIDLQARVDEALDGALSALDDADVQASVDEAVGALESSVAEARNVVAAAQAWAQQNSDVVCRGSSVGLGTTVGVTVFVLTGVEWLGLQSFWATERFTNGICGDLTE